MYTIDVRSKPHRVGVSWKKPLFRRLCGCIYSRYREIARPHFGFRKHRYCLRLNDLPNTSLSSVKACYFACSKHVFSRGQVFLRTAAVSPVLQLLHLGEIYGRLLAERKYKLSPILTLRIHSAFRISADGVSGAYFRFINTKSLKACGSTSSIHIG